MNKDLIMAAMLAVLIASGQTVAAEETSPEENDEPSCGVVYQGDHSSVEICDTPSIKIHRENPQDMVRIDKPLKPGPNAIVREVPEKVIEKPVRWFKKTFGL